MTEKFQLNLSKLFISILLIAGIYFCIIGGYGSDEDTLPMIGVYSYFNKW